MKNKNGLVAFALLGLAVGTAAYYLLATEDGKKTLDRANCGIKDLTKSIKDLSKKESKKASKFAERAKEELEKLTSKAKDAGKNILDRTSDKASTWADKASDAAQGVGNKAEDIIDQAKSDISKS